MIVRCHRTEEPHEYRVTLDGETIGNVWRVRFPGSASPQGSIGGYRDNHDGYRCGHWSWVADSAPEDEYPTRAEAVDDMRAVREARALTTTG